MGRAVGSPSASALSPVFLASPLKPGGRREHEVLGTCGPMLRHRLMLHRGPMLHSGPAMHRGLVLHRGLMRHWVPAMHQGPMLHHVPTLCPMWHLGRSLGLMLRQVWMQRWGLILHQGAMLVRCHRPVLHRGPTLHHGPTLHCGPVPPRGLVPPCTPILHQNRDGKQAHRPRTVGPYHTSPQLSLHWGSPGN